MYIRKAFRTEIEAGNHHRKRICHFWRKRIKKQYFRTIGRKLYNLFYSRGGISAENIPLTYTHGVWNYTSELQWNTDQSDAVVSAYYPYMESDNFTIYEPDGKLKDILYYTGNTRYGFPIF